MTDNKSIIADFIAAWSRLDVDELVSYFAEDGTYYNMPIEPVSGHDALRAFIGGFIDSWTKTDWETITLVGEGDIVVAERMDRTKLGEIAVDLPCCGVFEMEGGKIKVWRDYFDMATYMKPLGG